jgi:NADPH-dependent 2,4-dienoyl-CoA reductase/sulfur reductase-like enzyme
MKVVIIGGGIAGTSCAFFVRKFNKEAEIILIDKGKHKLYSTCVLPYLFSGEFDKNKIFIFDENYYKENRIKLILNTEVLSIDTKKKIVKLSNGKKLSYDYLVLATGSIAKNIDEKLLTFRNFEDYERLSKKLKNKAKVSIIGAGFVGTETAFSLRKRGHEVSLIEIENRILKNYVDEPISKLVEEELVKNGVKIYLKAKIKEIGKDFVKLETEGKERKIFHDVAVCCMGFMPNIDLAKKSGIKTDKGIIVDKRLETSEKNVFACGDCIEYYNFLTKEKEVTMLASLAVKQAEIVAKNVCGVQAELKENVNVFVSKIGNKFVGAVGLTKEKANQLGIECVSAFYTGSLYPKYYADKKISYFLIADLKGKIIGSQIFSDENIVGILNTLSIAVEMGMNVRDLSMLQTPYHPLCSDIIDPFTICAGILDRKINSKRGC